MSGPILHTGWLCRKKGGSNKRNRALLSSAPNSPGLDIRLNLALAYFPNDPAG
jgi:hypothetical protein